MTIAAAFITDEGVVFGADSTTTVVVPTGQVAQLFNNAQKIFQIGLPERARLGIATYGNGSLQRISHRNAVAKLSDRVEEGTTVLQAVDYLTDIANAAGANEPGSPLVGYFIGGIDPISRDPKCFKLTFGDGNQSRLEMGPGDCIFEGMPEFFTRVFYGYDPRLPGAVVAALVASLDGKLPPGTDVTQVAIDAVNQALKAIPSGMASRLPIRDAIDFVHTYLHLTIKAFKFRLGPPMCGGPIEIGFVTSDRPFRWVCHKRFDSAIYQGEGVL